MAEMADAERLRGLPVHIVHGKLDYIAPLALTVFLWVTLMNAIDLLPGRGFRRSLAVDAIAQNLRTVWDTVVACARALSFDPWNGIALYHVGLAQIQTGRFEDAREDHCDGGVVVDDRHRGDSRVA